MNWSGFSRSPQQKKIGALILMAAALALAFSFSAARERMGKPAVNTAAEPVASDESTVE